MTDTVRAAVVGLGWWGRQIVGSVAGSQWVQLTHAVEPDLEGARPFAETNGLSLHRDLDEVLDLDEIDAVMIVTPHRFHRDQVIAAAAAGKHVFCEKPLALNARDAAEMIAACRDRGLALGVGHERRFEGALEEAGRMASSGELGTLLHIECNWSHDIFTGAIASSWRQDPAQAPAGTLTALGVHITDYFQSVAGRVAKVSAVSTDRSARFAGSDVIGVQFVFASGATGSMCNLAATPFYSRISIFGDQAWVEAREWSNVDVPEPALLTWRGLDHEVHSRTFQHTDTVRANIDQWAKSALGLSTYRFSDSEILHNVQVLEAIVESVRSGHAIEIT